MNQIPCIDSWCEKWDRGSPNILLAFWAFGVSSKQYCSQGINLPLPASGLSIFSILFLSIPMYIMIPVSVAFCCFMLLRYRTRQLLLSYMFLLHLYGFDSVLVTKDDQFRASYSPSMMVAPIRAHQRDSCSCQSHHWDCQFSQVHSLVSADWLGFLQWWPQLMTIQWHSRWVLVGCRDRTVLLHQWIHSRGGDAWLVSLHIWMLLLILGGYPGVSSIVIATAVYRYLNPSAMRWSVFGCVWLAIHAMNQPFAGWN